MDFFLPPGGFVPCTILYFLLSSRGGFRVHYMVGGIMPETTGIILLGWTVAQYNVAFQIVAGKPTMKAWIIRRFRQIKAKLTQTTYDNFLWVGKACGSASAEIDKRTSMKSGKWWSCQIFFYTPVEANGDNKGVMLHIILAI